jgi:hypothetical protein
VEPWLEKTLRLQSLLKVQEMPAAVLTTVRLAVVLT